MSLRELRRMEKEQQDVATAIQERSEETRAALAKPNTHLDSFNTALKDIQHTTTTSKNQSVTLSS